MQTRSILSEDDLLLEADYLATGQPGDLIFKSGGAERARILNNGGVTGLLAQLGGAQTVSGVPTDGSFSLTPPDGRFALDTTTGWLYARTGGNWGNIGRPEFNLAKFGAIGVAPGVTPTVNEVTAWNLCMAAAAAAKGTVVVPARSYKVVNGNWSPGVSIQGSGGDWAGGGLGSRLYGETFAQDGAVNNPILSLPSTAGNWQGFWMQDLILVFGKYGVKSGASAAGVSNVFLERVQIAGQTEACLWTDCYIDNWRLRNCSISAGGTYAWYHVDGTGNANMDKCSFYSVTFNGGSTSGAQVYINGGASSVGSNAWHDCVFTGSLGNCLQLLGSASQGNLFENCNTEANGQSGKNHRTTIASLGATATSATLGSLTAGGSAATRTQTLVGSIPSSGPVSAITLNADPTSLWYTSGTVLIDSEAFHYTSRTGATLNGVTRAVENTAMAAHSNGATVSQIWSDATHANGGDQITIAGAGVNGAHLEKIIQTLDATTGAITWTGASSNTGTLTTVQVTNAIYDDVTLNGQGNQLINSFVGGEGTGGKLRYGLNIASSSSPVHVDAASSLGTVYDPQRRLVGITRSNVRQPPGFAAFDTNRTLLASSQATTTETPWSMVGTPPGKNLILGLTDSNYNQTGTFGNVEIRKMNASSERFAYFDATNLKLVLTSAGPAGTLQIDAGGSGGLILSGNSGTGHTVINSSNTAGGDIAFQGRGTTRLTVNGAAATVTFADPLDIVLGTTTGTKVGTGSTQKLAFRGLTPVAMPSTTGETVGFTAGAGTAVNDASTFTGNVGATAYRLSDIVKHLKNQGLIAA